jgi:hypothetical protein
LKPTVVARARAAAADRIVRLVVVVMVSSQNDIVSAKAVRN